MRLARTYPSSPDEQQVAAKPGQTLTGGAEGARNRELADRRTVQPSQVPDDLCIVGGNLRDGGGKPCILACENEVAAAGGLFERRGHTVGHRVPRDQNADQSRTADTVDKNRRQHEPEEHALLHVVAGDLSRGRGNDGGLHRPALELWRSGKNCDRIAARVGYDQECRLPQ